MSYVLLDYDYICKYVVKDFDKILENKIEFFTNKMPSLQFDKYGRAYLGHANGEYTINEIKQLSDAVTGDLLIKDFNFQVQSYIVQALTSLDITHIYIANKDSYIDIQTSVVNALRESDSYTVLYNEVYYILYQALLKDNGCLQVIKLGHKVPYKLSKVLHKYFTLCVDSSDIYQYYQDNNLREFLQVYGYIYILENPYLLYQELNNKKKNCDMYLTVNPIDMISLSKPFSSYSTCIDNDLEYMGNNDYITDNLDAEFSNPLLELLNSCILNKGLIYVPNSIKYPVKNYKGFNLTGYCYRNIVWLDSDKLVLSVDYPCEFIIPNVLPILNDIYSNTIIDSSLITGDSIIPFNIQDTTAIYNFINAWQLEIVQQEYSSIFLDRVCIDYRSNTLALLPYNRNTYKNIARGVFNPFCDAVCSVCNHVVNSSEIITDTSGTFEEEIGCINCY